MTNEDNEPVDELGPTASFDSPKNITPSKPGGEWDSPLDEMEAESWNADPDEFQGEDFVEDEEQQLEGGEPTEEVEEETDTEEVTEPEEDVAVEDEVPEEEQSAQLSPRANERIRQPVEEKNAERQRALNLEAQLAQFIAIQQQQAQRQEQAYRQQAEREALQAKAQKEAQFLENLRQYGFNEGDIGHQLSQQALEVAHAAREEARLLREERVQAQRAEGQRAYQSALVRELDKSISDPSGKLLVDNTTRETLYRAAYAVAAAEQIQNPGEAVKRVVAPILVELRKSAPKPPTKRPQPSNVVHKVISTQGRAAGKSPGTRASGKKPMAQDVKAFLK